MYVVGVGVCVVELEGARTLVERALPPEHRSDVEIDAALAKGVIYTPADGFNGDETLTVTANDQGHNPAGAPASRLKVQV